MASPWLLLRAMSVMPTTRRSIEEGQYRSDFLGGQCGQQLRGSGITADNAFSCDLSASGLRRHRSDGDDKAPVLKGNAH